MEVFCTAYQILFLVSKTEAGEYVLVHAAASGVGTSIIQLAKSAGIKTIAVASNNEKLTYCKEKLGADFTINYKETPEYQDKVLEFTEGKGVNVIADPVGAQNVSINAKCAAMDCRWILYGFLGGSKVPEFDMSLLLRKRIQLIATTLKNRSDQYKADLIVSVGKALFSG